jgi:starvation-inducible DNA-binding protein
MATSEVLSGRVKTENPHMGISTDETQQLADGLSRALAETYVLYLKTQSFHWNVVGPLFYGLHKMTEEQYQDLADAVDELAERIRALGHPAPASFAEFLELSAVKEGSKNIPVRQTIDVLVADHETVSRSFRKTVELAAQIGDVVTADLLTARIQAHEKAAWMLRSIIAQ